MKSYAEYLRDLIGKKGNLRSDDQSYIFDVGSLNNDILIDVGQDYSKFSVLSGGGRQHRFVPLNMLVVWMDERKT